MALTVSTEVKVSNPDIALILAERVKVPELDFDDVGRCLSLGWPLARTRGAVASLEQIATELGAGS